MTTKCNCHVNPFAALETAGKDGLCLRDAAERSIFRRKLDGFTAASPRYVEHAMKCNGQWEFAGVEDKYDMTTLHLPLPADAQPDERARIVACLVAIGKPNADAETVRIVREALRWAEAHGGQQSAAK